MAVLLTRDHELWGIALWLEKTHGDNGAAHIAAQVTRLATANDEAGIAMWRQVADRYDRLRDQGSVN